MFFNAPRQRLAKAFANHLLIGRMANLQYLYSILGQSAAGDPTPVVHP
jgi:hypothetical protein